jgi:hypothetical protein
MTTAEPLNSVIDRSPLFGSPNCEFNRVLQVAGNLSVATAFISGNPVVAVSAVRSALLSICLRA